MIAADVVRHDVVFRQLELVFKASWDEHRPSLRHLNTGTVGNVAGIGHQDLIARVEECTHDEIKGFADTDRDQDLGLGIVMNAVALLEIAGYLNAEFEQSTVAGVRGGTVAEGVYYGIADAPGRGEVGLADTEADHVVHADNEVEELANAGGLKALGEPGETKARARGGHGETASLRALGASLRITPSIL